MAQPNPLTRLIDAGEGVMVDYAAALDTGMGVDAWYEAMKQEVKRLNIQAAIAGRGGVRRMRPTDYGRVGRQLRDEYAFLRQFAQDVADGKLTTAQIAARANLYANHAQVSFWRARRATRLDAGFTQERRRLGVAEHCPDCQGYAAQGWQRIGTLPEPGVDSVCRANCKCTLEYRKR